jgi:hypothetical protein
MRIIKSLKSPKEFINSVEIAIDKLKDKLDLYKNSKHNHNGIIEVNREK